MKTALDYLLEKPLLASFAEGLPWTTGKINLLDDKESQQEIVNLNNEKIILSLPLRMYYLKKKGEKKRLVDSWNAYNTMDNKGYDLMREPVKDGYSMMLETHIFSIIGTNKYIDKNEAISVAWSEAKSLFNKQNKVHSKLKPVRNQKQQIIDRMRESFNVAHQHGQLFTGEYINRMRQDDKILNEIRNAKEITTPTTKEYFPFTLNEISENRGDMDAICLVGNIITNPVDSYYLAAIACAGKIGADKICHFVVDESDWAYDINKMFDIYIYGGVCLDYKRQQKVYESIVKEKHLSENLLPILGECNNATNESIQRTHTFINELLLNGQMYSENENQLKFKKEHFVFDFVPPINRDAFHNRSPDCIHPSDAYNNDMWGITIPTTVCGKDITPLVFIGYTPYIGKRYDGKKKNEPITYPKYLSK